MKIDFMEHKILVEDNVIYLTLIQNKILKLLNDNKGKIVTYEQLVKEIYNLECDEFLKQAIRRHVSLLRKRINKYIKIHTINSVGYVIEEGLN